MQIDYGYGIYLDNFVIVQCNYNIHNTLIDEQWLKWQCMQEWIINGCTLAEDRQWIVHHFPIQGRGIAHVRHTGDMNIINFAVTCEKRRDLDCENCTRHGSGDRKISCVQDENKASHKKKSLKVQRSLEHHLGQLCRTIFTVSPHLSSNSHVLWTLHSFGEGLLGFEAFYQGQF